MTRRAILLQALRTIDTRLAEEGTSAMLSTVVRRRTLMECRQRILWRLLDQ